MQTNTNTCGKGAYRCLLRATSTSFKVKPTRFTSQPSETQLEAESFPDSGHPRAPSMASPGEHCLCVTAGPQAPAQLFASHAGPVMVDFPFLPHYHITDPGKGPQALSKTRPVSPLQHTLTHIHWALRSRVLHVFPKGICRNPNKRNKAPRAFFLVSPPRR